MSDERPRPPRASRPDSHPELDEQLRSYLGEVQRERAEGFTLQALTRQVHELQSQVTEGVSEIGDLKLEVTELKLEVHEQNRQIGEIAFEQKAMRLRMDRHGKDIRELKRMVFHSDDDMDTGSHQVEDLRKHLAAKETELKEQRDSVWWRRQKVQWFGAALGTATMAIVGGAATVIWYLLTHH